MPCGIKPAWHVQRVKYIMGRICDTQSCEGYREKAQVKKGAETVEPRITFCFSEGLSHPAFIIKLVRD
jgi:hypothetical protein